MSDKITATVRDGNNSREDDEWKQTANAYTVTLHYQGRRMSVPFFTGSGWKRDPDASDVMYCMASDARGIENAGEFDDWCLEYGFDTDSRKAMRTYKQCWRQTEKLRKLLGADYENIIYMDEDQLKEICAEDMP